MCAVRERYPMTVPPIRWEQHREMLLSAVRVECSSWLVGHARGYTKHGATSTERQARGGFPTNASGQGEGDGSVGGLDRGCERHGAGR